MRLRVLALSVGILLCACEERTTPLNSNEARARINEKRQEDEQERQREERRKAFNAKPIEVNKAEAEEFWAQQVHKGVTDTEAGHWKRLYTDTAYLDQASRDYRILHAEQRASNPAEIRFASVNIAYLSWRVGRDLEFYEYEVLRDAYVKHYFGKPKVTDEMEFFDMIAAQFKAPRAQR